MIKVFAKKAYEFTGPKGERAVTLPLVICPMPDWVQADPMFKAAQSAGNIEIISTQEQKRRVQNGEDDTELMELRAKAAEMGIANAAKMGKEKLRASIAAEEVKRQNGGENSGGENSGGENSGGEQTPPA